jgi:hypothetical protein
MWTQVMPPKFICCGQKETPENGPGSAAEEPAERQSRGIATAVELSIVMSCLNDVETLRSCIREIQSYADWSAVSGATVGGVNASSDGSLKIAREFETGVFQNLMLRGCKEVKEESGWARPGQARSLAS